MGFSTLATLAAAMQAPLDYVPPTHQESFVANITTDSRDVRENALFIALTGDRFDGHGFVEAAIAQGALAAVVEQDKLIPHLPCLPVADTLVAYQALGHWWRTQQQASIVAITGSVGKTTTKELIAAALGTQGAVHKTQANYNNDIGVPKTLLQLQPEHAFGVIEMGMRGPGEIARLARIAVPDVAVITNVGTAHIGRLGSEQAIANAKCELLAESPQAIAVLNHDNARLIATARTVWAGRTITFGLEGGDIQGQLVNPETLDVQGVRLPLPLPGRHNALNLLAAIAVMQALDLDWRVLSQGISVDLPSGRARQISLPNDIVLLDETYNAGVESMTAALHLLAETPGQRRIAVLGTMKELGERSFDLHRQVGQVVDNLGLDALLTLADPDESLALAEGAAGVKTASFADHQSLAQHLQGMLQPGDRVLLKASRSVALDRVVETLTQVFSS
ncbi:UDP-N-acetylmuramoyl-tripeptide--D-alanyl-D-alanine ligase [Phormidium tenue FACHB-1052]|uniref:UDP-N-acetylmuramoyl-tripeptide--D-alanyl-D-alanine ligase n=2 Tax=Phormidium tenue TaxID=126344 RepID=A0A1U7J706_9CYAN|nr:UDP-N-acetylmuramoyl-tripeptide--D-alanyl-D-alanine ligase [Phormidium tenue]MBD2232307.1 UDP-N-acetylmuramoyl-tripeptide--D-alanyl-D-alanine ligase [Phormidium tenue FACHB-1052]OKH48758.1 UDP-N-acetylmuramoyl-tripeptide--D-alanyl-D-alanine ligase [Phormidium tenue NIES-30]